MKLTLTCITNKMKKKESSENERKINSFNYKYLFLIVARKLASKESIRSSSSSSKLDSLGDLKRKWGWQSVLPRLLVAHFTLCSSNFLFPNSGGRKGNMTFLGCVDSFFFVASI